MKIKNQIIKFITVFTLAFTLFSCSEDDKTEIAKLPTILEIAKADTNYSVFVKSLEVTGLSTPTTNPFSSAGSYTVFLAPNNAFATYITTNFPTGITNDTFTDTTTGLPKTLTAAQILELKKILQNHIIGVGTKANDLLANGYSKTFTPFGNSTSVTLSMFVNKVGNDVLINGGVTNGGAKVTATDIDASNGIVHVVDNLIKLPTVLNHMEANPNLSKLVSIIKSKSGAYGDQSNVITAISLPAVVATSSATNAVTVFAPSDGAFDIALASGGYLTGAVATPTNISKVLNYHIATSATFTINNNGVIAPSNLNGNVTATSSTSFTPSTVTATATTDVTVTTKAATNQTFKIGLATVKISEIPAIATPASNIKLVNIQGSNGTVHIIDRVLQPVL